jgi:hypothetical protein
MNGFGGLEALSAEGKKIWHVSLGNVWGQAVLSAGLGGQALVFATEAGGTVRVFDGQGRALRTLRPGGAYYTRLAAGIMDQSGQAQLLALGQNLGGSGEQAVAFDSKGQIVWSAPVKAGGSWVQSRFASGQIGGDNNAVWAFIDSSGDLVLATADGEKLAAIPNQSSVGDFMIVPGKNGRGLLVVLRGPTVEAYSFE